MASFPEAWCVLSNNQRMNVSRMIVVCIPGGGEGNNSSNLSKDIDDSSEEEEEDSIFPEARLVMGEADGAGILVHRAGESTGRNPLQM